LISADSLHAIRKFVGPTRAVRDPAIEPQRRRLCWCARPGTMFALAASTFATCAQRRQAQEKRERRDGRAIYGATRAWSCARVVRSSRPGSPPRFAPFSGALWPSLPQGPMRGHSPIRGVPRGPGGGADGLGSGVDFRRRRGPPPLRIPRTAREARAKRGPPRAAAKRGPRERREATARRK